MILFCANASAQDDLIEYLVSSCESDIETYCSQVTPGNGRMLHCAAAHEDKLSGQCRYALYRAATLLEQLSVAIAYLAESCQTEMQNYCSDVMPGEGRMVACLKEQEENLGEACTTAIAETVGE